MVTVGVMDLNVYDLSTTGRNCFLSLTTPRSLVGILLTGSQIFIHIRQQSTTSRSALKLRFTSPSVGTLPILVASATGSCACPDADKVSLSI